MRRLKLEDNKGDTQSLIASHREAGRGNLFNKDCRLNVIFNRLLRRPTPCMQGSGLLAMRDIGDF